MKHRGELFQKAVAKTQISVTRVAKMLEVSPRQIYKLYEKEKISNEDLVKYGKILGYDFSKDLPELVDFMVLRDPQEVYLTNAQYRDKYFNLMEEYIEQSKELAKFRAAALAEDKKKKGKDGK